MIYQTTPVAAYRRRLRHEMFYRAMFLRAWAKRLDIESPALRNLRIQIEKLGRLCKKDELHYLHHPVPAKRLESTKHAQRIVDKRNRKLTPQYKVVLSYIPKVLQDLASRKNKGTPTKAELRNLVQQVVGATDDFVRKSFLMKKRRKKLVKKKRKRAGILFGAIR
jgi:hypothetical protein